MKKLKAIVEYQRTTSLGCSFQYKSIIFNTLMPKTPKEFIVYEQWKLKKAFWLFEIKPDGLNIKLYPIFTAKAKEDSKPMMRATLYEDPKIEVIKGKLYLNYEGIYVLVKTKTPIVTLPNNKIDDERYDYLKKIKFEKIIANFHIEKLDTLAYPVEHYYLKTDFRQIVGKIRE